MKQLQGHTDFLYGVAWSPDGSKIATASHDFTARVWDASTGAEVKKLQGHTDRPYTRRAGGRQ